LESITSPENRLSFHTVRKPPKAPLEGEKANWLNHLGQKFLRYPMSKAAHFVSCKQKATQELSSILLWIAFHFLLSFIPLTFHERTLQFLFG
jgi:hypothetical protein